MLGSRQLDELGTDFLAPQEPSKAIGKQYWHGVDATEWVSHNFLVRHHIVEWVLSRFVLLVPCILADCLGHKKVEPIQ